MSTDRKVVIAIAIATGAILIGAVFLISKDTSTSIPPEDIVATGGLHWHPKLTVTIKGEKQEIPANIGIAGQIHQEIHTHDADNKEGIIHMEMQGLVTKDETKLGNFFRVWGKEFNSTKILDKVATGEGEIKITVNGRENKEFDNYEMKDKDVIEITYE